MLDFSVWHHAGGLGSTAVRAREGDTTRLRDEWKLDTGRPAVLERLAGGRVKSAVAENLAKLKELLEEDRVILQDGRRVSL